MTSKSHDSGNEKPVKVIKLSKSYTFGEKKISECKILREPLATDLKGLALGKGLMDDQFILLGRISDLSTVEIEKLTMGDAILCVSALDDFLPESLRTGKSS